MEKTSIDSPTAPPAVRLLLIVLLPVFAVLLYLDGQVYDADLLDFQGTDGAGGKTAQLFPDRVAGLERSGQVREFHKDNLYEYINGHAEYFIGAGFQALAVGEYGTDDADQPRIVINLYDMGGALNAFGVLANEAGDQDPVDVGSLGFRGSQGVNFVQGPYYAQVSLFDPALDPLLAAQDMSTRLADIVSSAELAFRFPDLGPVKATRFVREYYRGMEFLNNVVERSFERDDGEIQAFVISGTPGEIEALEQNLTGFLTEDGIAFKAQERNGLLFVTVEDPYEGNWFFVPLDGMAIGVYAPLDPDLVTAISRFAAEPSADTDKPGGRSGVLRKGNYLLPD